MACTIDESSLPILTGCPGPNELIVVANAVGGLDANGSYTTGYGRRTFGSIAACIVSAIQFVLNNFIVGQAGDLLGVNGTTITLTFSSLGITTVIQDSVFLTFGGSELPRNNDTQISYQVEYNATNVVITLNQGAQLGQWYILHYSCY